MLKEHLLLMGSRRNTAHFTQCLVYCNQTLQSVLNRLVRGLEWKPPGEGLPLQFPNESNRPFQK